MDDLTKLAIKYGTDKCPQIKHTYTPFYDMFFKDRRESVKKVIELGIGTPETMKHVRFYRLGASLYMWREYFPNAQIYGVDIQPQAIFTDERIRCFLGDELKKETWDRVLEKTGTDIDVFIDDGSHQKEHQIAVVKMVLPRLKEDAIYIIEDVEFPAKIYDALPEYNCIFIKSPSKHHDDNLMIVERK